MSLAVSSTARADQYSALEKAPTYAMPGVEISGFITDDGGSGEINAILPLSMPTSHQLFFIGADGKLFDGGLGGSVYNAGAYLGYRERMGDAVLGAWMGADTLQTRYGRTFNRFIAGAEYYGSRVIARVTGFAPFDNTSDEWSTAAVTSTTVPVIVTTPATITTLARTTTTTVTTFFDEKVPSGIDGEIGLRFAAPAIEASLRDSEFRMFIGGYDYFGLKAGGGDVPGVRGRLELDLYPFREAQEIRLSFVGSYSHDDFSGGQFETGARLSIPFGGPRSPQLAYSGSLKDGGGSLKDDPRPITVASNASQDLFQPVRRNREPVSIIRQKRQVSTSQVTDTVSSVKDVPQEQTAGYTLATVCGGPAVAFANAGGSPITQGTVIGTRLSDGSDVIFDISIMTDAGGQTLAQLLSAQPASISTTLSFPLGTGILASATVASDQSCGAPTISSLTLIVNNNTCSLQALVQISCF